MLDPRTLSVPDALSLVVAWRRGARLQGGEIRINAAVAAFLRRACDQAVQRVRDGRVRPYNADMILEDDEVIEIFDQGMIEESVLRPILLSNEPLDTIAARLLPQRPLLLYATTFMDERGRRMAFVRKTNPHYGPRPGGILASLGNVLTEVGQPVFTLESTYDFIVCAGGVVVFNQNVFELLFKETDTVLAAVPGWISTIAQHLPLAQDGAAILAQMAQRNRGLRRRLRAIHERGHLATVSIDKIRNHLRQLGVDEELFIHDNQLIVNESDSVALLDVLNEDLFAGGLTGTRFRSERKSPRQ
jgi:hypothetical protein